MRKFQEVSLAKIGTLCVTLLVLCIGYSSLPRALGLIGAITIPPSKESRSLNLEIHADPVIVASADRLSILGVLSTGIVARESRLIVRDSSGSIVYSKGGELGRSESPLDIVTGRPLPESLSPGAYSMVWTVDGAQSNTEHFTVGPEQPDLLTAEYLGDNCSDANLLVHVYSEKPLNYCHLITGMTVGVDSDERLVETECSDAVRGSKVSGAFTAIVPPWRLQLTPSRPHEVWVSLDGQRSKTVRATCK
jgi:hypothetical protein